MQGTRILKAYRYRYKIKQKIPRNEMKFIGEDAQIEKRSNNNSKKHTQN